MNYYTFQVTIKAEDRHTVISVTNYLAASDKPLVCEDLYDALDIPSSPGLTADFKDFAPVDLLEYGDVIAQPAIAHNDIKIWVIGLGDQNNAAPTKDHL